MRVISLSKGIPPLLLISSLMMLAGCQPTLKAPKLAGTRMGTYSYPSEIHFTVTGKIGVRTPTQTGSAFYAWTQVDKHFAIDLTGALGIGQTHIEGQPGKVTLRSARTGLINASSPEELLQHATGWQAPISYLAYWIEGRPAHADSISEYDDSHRLTQLSEGGWQVIFTYKGTEALPSKLNMSQPSGTGENRVTLTVQSRGNVPQS
jgi:outer membrane lipoprotein LolB